MSKKYIDLEEAIEVVAEEDMTFCLESSDWSNAKLEEFKEDVRRLLSKITAVKSIEDCVSRKEVEKLLFKIFNKQCVAELTPREKGFLSELQTTPASINIKEGKWIKKEVKELCPPDCWYPGAFAIEGTWNEEEGSWLEEEDGFCSECGEQDEHYYGHKYCPSCGAKMKKKDEVQK